MKKIGYVVSLLVLMFSLNANAQKCTKEMLEQVSNIDSSWRPIVGNSLYSFEKNGLSFIVIRLYDANKPNNDPEATEIQAVFVKKGKTYKLEAITFSPVDLTNSIGLLVE